jgi:hypothetical protein
MFGPQWGGYSNNAFNSLGNFSGFGYANPWQPTNTFGFGFAPWSTQPFQNPTNTLGFPNTTNTTNPTQALTQLLFTLTQQTQQQLQVQQFALWQAITLLQQVSSSTQLQGQQQIQQQIQQPGQQQNTFPGYGLGWGMFPGSLQGQQLHQQQLQQQWGSNNLGTPNNTWNNTNAYSNGFTSPQGFQGQPLQGFQPSTNQALSQGFTPNTQFNPQGNTLNSNAINQAYGPAVFGQGTAPWQQAFPAQNIQPINQSIPQTQSLNQAQSLNTTQQTELVEPTNQKRITRQTANLG